MRNNMKTLKNMFWVILILGLIQSCNDPYLNTPYTNIIENFPAATYMENDTVMEVSLWVDLLKHSDMFNTLNLQADYTCFVPEDAAIEQYLKENNYASLEDMPLETARLLVRYHTIKGTRYSSVDFSNGMIPDSTASGDYLTTAFLENGGQVQINEEALILKTKQVTNAYIHLIDKVLNPVTETIWDKLSKPEFSIMKDAFELCGLNDKLNTIITEETSNGVTSQRKYRYTLFAVPDSVFVNSGINSAMELADSLSAGTDYTAQTNMLNQFMAYHLLNQQYSFADLAYFTETDKVRSKNYNTLATNQLINVSEKNQAIYINWNKSTLTGVAFLVLNQNCKNGVIHVVNNKMMVTTPSATKVRWELTDYPELSFISFYRKASSTSTQTMQISTEDVSCYNWLSVPESKNGLTYELSNKNESVKIKALNADYLILSLGTFGWVEMKTPTLIAGKYAVYCEHFNPKGTALGGRLSFILDGAYFGSQISTSGASKTTDQYLTSTKIGEITFTETNSHMLRILAGDNNSAYLDCITFSPM